jgi:hypothetical protein
MIRYLNLILDRAERMFLLTTIAGLSLGIGTGLILHGRAWAWPFLITGLIFTAIRPAGTMTRQRWRIRQLRKELRNIHERAGL